MNTTELEKGIVGDFLMSHAMISPTPLKGVVGAKRLRPDHFTDSSALAAFELIMNFEDEDPLKLFSLISRKMGAEWTDKEAGVERGVMWGSLESPFGKK